MKQVALNVFEMLGAVRKKISYFGDNKASIHGKSETDYHRVSTTSSDFSSCGFDCVNFYGLATENDNSLLVSS